MVVIEIEKGLQEVGIYLRSKLEAIKKGNAINASLVISYPTLGCSIANPWLHDHCEFFKRHLSNREVRWLRALEERDILALLVFFTVGFFIHPLVVIDTPKDEGAGVDLCDISFR